MQQAMLSLAPALNPLTCGGCRWLDQNNSCPICREALTALAPQQAPPPSGAAQQVRENGLGGEMYAAEVAFRMSNLHRQAALEFLQESWFFCISQCSTTNAIAIFWATKRHAFILLLSKVTGPSVLTCKLSFCGEMPCPLLRAVCVCLKLLLKGGAFCATT